MSVLTTSVRDQSGRIDFNPTRSQYTADHRFFGRLSAKKLLVEKVGKERDNDDTDSAT